MQQTVNKPQGSRAHNLWYFSEQKAAMFGFTPDHPGQPLLQREIEYLSSTQVPSLEIHQAHACPLENGPLYLMLYLSDVAVLPTKVIKSTFLCILQIETKVK